MKSGYIFNIALKVNITVNLRIDIQIKHWCLEMAKIQGGIGVSL